MISKDPTLNLPIIEPVIACTKITEEAEILTYEILESHLLAISYSNQTLVLWEKPSKYTSNSHI